MRRATVISLLFWTFSANATKPENVLVVVNGASALSRDIGDYYQQRRAIPKNNICVIQIPERETITRQEYDRLIAAPVASCLKFRRLVESVLYIAITQGVPIRVKGSGGVSGDIASVDSELALLYSHFHGQKHALAGPLPNPFFRQRDADFRHPQFPIYLVTRLAAYNLAGVKAMIDRSLAAKNAGKFVFDLRSGGDVDGDSWLRNAAIVLPKDRVVLEESSTVVYGQKRVIGYASWGSNDKNRRQRHLGFDWLPGAIATEYVSTDGRTFERPPDSWNIGTWGNKATWFAGSPQSMTLDFIAEGATGASGHVNEPYLQFTPRPDFLLPAYHDGRNLAESYYLSLPALSWQNIIIGDPLCSLGPPR
ncbi:MAG TPA: TIGR03790 family protein [Bryobacteraceae bacterium]|nr:TIGR03790 family protein [Bryobacteraceae bacterium]